MIFLTLFWGYLEVLFREVLECWKQKISCDHQRGITSWETTVYRIKLGYCEVLKMLSSLDTPSLGARIPFTKHEPFTVGTMWLHCGGLGRGFARFSRPESKSLRSELHNLRFRSPSPLDPSHSQHPSTDEITSLFDSDDSGFPSQQILRLFNPPSSIPSLCQTFHPLPTLTLQVQLRCHDGNLDKRPRRFRGKRQRKRVSLWRDNP
jgi:hypothetical protein